MIKYFFTGFFVKIITGFDDTLTQIPLISYFTKTKKGKIAYSVGIILAISLAVFLSLFLSKILSKIPNYKFIVAGLIFLLAIIIYFDFFHTKENRETKKKIIKLKKLKPLSKKQFLRLMILGFFASFATIIDDTIVFSSIISQNRIFIISGIFIATLLEISLILIFSTQINKLKYKKEISTIGLIILSILIFIGII